MTIRTPKDLFLQTLRNELSAEREIIKALAKIESKAIDPKLKQALLSHRNEIEGHIISIEQIFTSLGNITSFPSCKGAVSLTERIENRIDEIGERETIEAALTSLALAVKHYEIEKDARSKIQRQQEHRGFGHENLYVVRN